MDGPIGLNSLETAFAKGPSMRFNFQNFNSQDDADILILVREK